MRILLIPPKNNYPNPSPDIDFGQGVAYLAGALKAAGHQVFGINMSCRWCHGSASLTLEGLMLEAIEKYKPQLIGVGGMAPDYLYIRDVIFFARKIAPDIPTVIGGGIVTYDPEYIFSDICPDFAVIGEGEIPIVKLADYIENKGEIESVPSLVYCRNGEVVRNEVKYPENLDDLPFPDYAPFDFENFLSLNNHTNNYLTHTRSSPRIIPISIGRSCPFKCTFCSRKSEYRARSIDNAIEEINHLYEKYQFNILYINDELFLNKAERVSEFCSKVKTLKRDLKTDFDWVCYSRVNDVSIELLKEIKDAGCKSIGYGFESASDIVLKSMKKATTAGQILRALQLTKEAGMGVYANFIFGDIAETPETIRETIAFYNKYCRDFAVFFYYITPYPGSEIFQYCLDKKLITDNRRYYETVASSKGYVNMTKMSDEVFRELTVPVMSDIFNDKTASVLSCEKMDNVMCDRNAPFELRRSFYRIKAVCPHCLGNAEYLYPLRKDKSGTVRSFVHFCPHCHKKLIVDLARDGYDLGREDDAYSRFYQEKPYTNYYPFDIAKHAMPSVSTPQLLESYKAYNIIRYANYIYAVAQAIGPFDLTELEESQLNEYLKKGMCFIGNSVEEVKTLIGGKVKTR